MTFHVYHWMHLSCGNSAVFFFCHETLVMKRYLQKRAQKLIFIVFFDFLLQLAHNPPSDIVHPLHDITTNNMTPTNISLDITNEADCCKTHTQNAPPCLDSDHPPSAFSFTSTVIKATTTSTDQSHHSPPAWTWDPVVMTSMCFV